MVAHACALIWIIFLQSGSITGISITDRPFFINSPNFSLYLDSLLSINRGDDEDIPEKVLGNLEDWGYIEVHDEMILVIRKGINVLEFYLKNREFMISSTSQIQEAVLKGFPK